MCEWGNLPSEGQLGLGFRDSWGPSSNRRRMLIGILPFPLHSPSLSGVLPLDDEGIVKGP